MSFRGAAKATMAYRKYASSFRWYLCLLQLIRHQVRNVPDATNDPGGTGNCSELLEWKSKLNELSQSL